MCGSANAHAERIHGGVENVTAIFRVLAAARLEKGKNVRSLSPLSGAPRRIGAVADEERYGPQFD